MVGAGEGVTKSELKLTREVKEWPPLFLRDIRLEHVSWQKNVQLVVHRYMYDEPRSGILISFDFLVKVGEMQDLTMDMIEQDLLNQLRIRG